MVKVKTKGTAKKRLHFWELWHGRERRRIGGQILAALLGSPATRVDGHPWNSDTDLPELAEVAINAADALILASKRPRNRGLIKS
jgi:hypothetical protein